MKVLVGIKRVVDYAVKVRVNKGTVELANVKQSMNPFCEVSCMCVCQHISCCHLSCPLADFFFRRSLTMSHILCSCECGASHTVDCC
jgi:hypothetical protein